jgi:DNA-binding Lrp family transcriptional regulator
MPMAYVLLNLEPGDESQVLRSLRKVATVQEAHRIYGVYDIIVRVEAENMDKLRETISKHVRSLDKVRSTLTMMVIE